MASGHSHELVWVRNPYPEEETGDATYREAYLPSEWCGAPAFVPGTIEGRLPGDDSRVVALTSLHPPLRIVGDPREFPLRPTSARLVNDLTTVEHINHATVLDQILRRFGSDRVFTSVGPAVLVSVNPRRPVSIGLPPVTPGASERAVPAVGLFSPPVMQRYFQREIGGPGAGGLPPHIFQVADDMFKSAIRDATPQAAVLVGESGSGKSEAAKQIVRYLASVSRAAAIARGGGEGKVELFGGEEGAMKEAVTVARGRLPNGITLEHALAEALPVLEAFSAYASPGLPSASRSGTIVRLRLRPDGQIAGARIDAALFDVSRAARVPTAGGRTFHAYHEALAGLPDAARRAADMPDSAAQLRLLHTARVDPTVEVTDAQRFHGLLRSLRAVGVDTADLAGIWRVMAAVLWLGNVQPVASQTAEGGITGQSWDLGDAAAFDRAARCLGTEKGSRSLAAALFGVGASAETTKTAADAQSRIASLACSLHTALFSFLLRRINESLAALSPGSGPDMPALESLPEVAVLDLPGMQAAGRVDISSMRAVPATLGDLLANHAAEVAESFVRAHTLHLDAHIYGAEGIAPPESPAAPIPSPSIQTRVITAIESDAAPLGVLAVMREAAAGRSRKSGPSSARKPSIVPPSSDSDAATSTRWATALRNLRRSGVFRSAEPVERRVGGLSDAAFALRHTIGEVLYEPRNFVDDHNGCFATQAVIEAIRATTLPVSAGGPTVAEMGQLMTSGPLTVSDAAAFFGEIPHLDAFQPKAKSSKMPIGAEATKFAPSPPLFDEWVHEALASARESDVRVVRCISACPPGAIKPGSSPTSVVADPEHIVRQLVSSAIAATASVRASGLPNRAPLREFYDRFVILAPQMVREAGPRLDDAAPLAPASESDAGKARAHERRRHACRELIVAIARTVGPTGALFGLVAGRGASVKELTLAEAARRRLALSGIGMLSEHVQVGRTRVFMTDAFLRSLELARRGSLGSMDTAATIIQRHGRGLLARREFNRAKNAAIRIQGAIRMHQERSAFVFHRKYALELKRHVVAFGRRKHFEKKRSAACTIQRAWRRYQGRAEFHESRHAILTAHVLARGFLLREAILQRHRALIKIQRAARDFVVLNRAFWARERAATSMEALWRGYRTRRRNARVVGFLTAHRMQAAKKHFFRQVFARFKGRLVRSRFLVMRATTRHLQRWIRAQLARKSFWRRWTAAFRFQALVRGHLTRRLVGSMRALNDAAQEAWRVHRQRHVETANLAAHGTVVHSLAFWHAGTAPSGGETEGSGAVPAASNAMRRMLDVDVIQCSQGVYKDVPVDGSKEEDTEDRQGLSEDVAKAPSWTQSASDLEAQLLEKGHCSRSFALGSTHTLALGSDGNVYSWGWSDRGQTGHGDVRNRTEPRKVLALSEAAFRVPGIPRVNPQWAPKTVVTCIAAGADHSLAVSSAGAAYAWGSNQRGQLGLGSIGGRVLLPTHVSSIRRKVATVAAGAHHSVFLTAAGSVYTSGAAECVGLGRDVSTVMMGERPLPDQPLPVGVAALSRFSIRSISCGWGHSVALSSSGDMFSWGHGKYGQLGLGRKGDRHVPALIQPPSEYHVQGAAHAAEIADARVRAFVDATQTPTASSPPHSPMHLGAAAATSSEHDLVRNIERAVDAADPESLAAEQELAQLSVEARVLVAARRRSTNPQFPASKSPFVTGSLTQKDAARVYFSPVTTSDGPASKSMALMETTEADDHEAIIRPYCVSQVVCGAFHTIAVTRAGAVLTFGRNTNGQLGTGDKEDRTWPVAVRGSWCNDKEDDGETPVRALRVSAGWRSSVVLTSDNRVFHFGHAGAVTEDRLRHELNLHLQPSDPESYIEPVEILQPEPVSLRGCEGYTANDIEMAWSSGLSVLTGRFVVGPESASTVRAVMEQLAEQADDVFGPLVEEGGDGNLDYADKREELEEVDLISPPTPEEEAEGVAEMLQNHPELRATYATVLTERKVRRHVERDARAAAAEDGLTEAQTAMYVASVLPKASEQERLVEASVQFYVHKQRREAALRRHVQQGVARATGDGRGSPSQHRPGALVGRGVAPSPAALAVRWRVLTPVERFRALGLSKKHLSILSSEQLSRLAFALRAKSHESAKPGLRSVKPKRRSPRAPTGPRTADWYGRVEPPSRVIDEELLGSGYAAAEYDDDDESKDDPGRNSRHLRKLEEGWNPVFINKKSIRRITPVGKPSVPALSLPRFLAEEMRLASSPTRAKHHSPSDSSLLADSAADAYQMELLIRATGDVSISDVVSADAARATMAALDLDTSMAAQSHELSRFQTIAMAIAATANQRMSSTRRKIRKRAAAESTTKPLHVSDAFYPAPSRGAAGGTGLGNASHGLFGQRRDAHRDVLLAGGRYDVAERQRAEFEAMHREEAHRRNKEMRRAQKQAQEDAWRRQTRGDQESRDLLSQFSPEMLVATKRAVDIGRANAKLQASIGSTISQSVADSRAAAAVRATQEMAEAARHHQDSSSSPSSSDHESINSDTVRSLPPPPVLEPIPKAPAAFSPSHALEVATSKRRETTGIVFGALSSQVHKRTVPGTRSEHARLARNVLQSALDAAALGDEEEAIDMVSRRPQTTKSSKLPSPQFQDTPLSAILASAPPVFSASVPPSSHPLAPPPPPRREY